MGIFMVLLVFVLGIVWVFQWYNPNFGDVLSQHNIKNEQNITTTEENKVLKQKNYIELWEQSNHIFELKKEANLMIDSTMENAASQNISIQTVKDYAEEFYSLNPYEDFKIKSCSRGDLIDCDNFKMQSNGDFIIYEIQPEKSTIRLNQLMLENYGLQEQKIEVSFLWTSLKDWSTIIGYSFEYFLLPWSNLMKFPLIDLKVGEHLYVKIKLLEKNA